jgi:endonuclease/exonuclease/phosphatase family metal-dependent hydrolase
VELENLGVLEDLANFELAKRGYYWTAFANLPGMSLGLGVLSRFPITDIRTHSITSGNQTAPRPVLEVRVEPNGKPLVFLLCHWKSKLGGADETEALRRSSARVVARRIRELNEDGNDTPVIVMGDLNEHHDDFLRRGGKVFCALLPDPPEAAALADWSPGTREEFLVLSVEKPPKADHFPEGLQTLYSAWEAELGEGSYYYKDSWETIDHFLLSGGLFDELGWEYHSTRVVNHAPFIGTQGAPASYVARHGRGLSDHLPLLLYLRYSADG